MTENKQLMEQARETLKDKWGMAVGVTFIYAIITIVVGSPDDIGPGLQILIEGPLMVGMALFFLSLNRKHEIAVSQLFAGFNDYIRSLAAYVIMTVFILLWSLLLIVPGVIAALAYSQTFFILADDKSIGARDAIRKSKAMMEGHKKKLFYLICRFLGWFLLGVLSLGIGFLWILPYMYVTMAKFYEEVSAPKQ